ncbi:hypothetical protein GOODEAATRI_032710 [Goodea atripinnis]|uniref:Uncharacterized protein n=1 Tax=Goodea atripinnis TaxID=208336 RepID=A0ABV0NFN2_9TELE
MPLTGKKTSSRYNKKVMAAVTGEPLDSLMSKVSDLSKGKVRKNIKGDPDELGKQDDSELEFLEKEHSSILKSSRNVCELLEKVREETDALEEQVGWLSSKRTLR